MPSGRCILWEPQKRSSVSPGFRFAAPQFRGAGVEIQNHAGGIAGVDRNGTRVEQSAIAFFTVAPRFPRQPLLGDILNCHKNERFVGPVLQNLDGH